MYVQHFGLEHEPFSIAPDPRYLYLSERHREALAHLLYGLGGGGGFVLLTGDIGAGKTTVCRGFLEQVPPHCQVAYIFNPKLTVVELLAAVCEEFGIGVPDASHTEATVKRYIDPLNRFLLDAHAAGRNCVLVIDEAQQLSAEVLEQLRLLTNLETNERKLLQIVLVGQPELRDMLAAPGLEQLAQRVIARYHLGPLSEVDTAHYLQHRLAVAGLKNASPLGPALARRVHRLSGGVPRRINLLCDRALLGAYSQGLAEVDGATLLKAAREIEGDGAARRPAGWRWRRRESTAAERWRLAAAFAASGMLVLIAFGIGWRAADGSAEQVLAVAAPAAMPATGSASAAADSGVRTGVKTANAAGTATSPAAAARHAAPLKPDELRRLLRLHGFDEATAWRSLASRWGVALPEAGDPCAAASKQSVNCFKGGGGMALVRQLDRPAVLALRDGDAPPVHALLVGIDPQHAWLQIGADTWPVPLTELAAWWRGDFATLWRAPQGVSANGSGAAGGSAQAGAMSAWLSERLRGVGMSASTAATATAPETERVVRGKLVAFQASQGLDADGLPGPLTLMALNRASGVAEPRLTAQP